MTVLTICRLCSEATSFIQNQDKIRTLSTAHANVDQVLGQLEDIIDLPSRAQLVVDMLEDEHNMVRAFRALTVLEGTCVNVKRAWTRNAKKQEETSNLHQYLTRVGEAVELFENKLWALVKDFSTLAKNKSWLVVDCAQVIEMQERLDAELSTSRSDYYQRKHYKERFFLEVERAVEDKFASVLKKVEAYGEPNTTVRHDQEDNTILHEERDYLGTLTKVVRIDKNGKQVPAGPDVLPSLIIQEVHSFDEDSWVDNLLVDLCLLEGDLPEAYDYLAPCLPPHYAIFDTIFQHYHLRFARVIDMAGQYAEQLTTPCQLKVMQWVNQYQETLRNLGVEEALVLLPVAPWSDPEGRPGMSRLIESYTTRMEQTLTTWFKNILEADLNDKPKQNADGTLRTPGAVEFFRILSEQIAIIEDISRADVLYESSARALKLMTAFTDAQQAVLKRELSLELLCAFLNNNLDCYQQSLEFTDHVKENLESEYKEKLEVEEVCRKFLEVSKAAARKVVDFMFNDPGMANNLKAMFMSSDWLTGTVTATVLATIKDYFEDLQVFVDPSFYKRLVELSLEDLVRRYVTALITSIPTITDPLVDRMEKDEHDIQRFYEQYLKADRVARCTQQLGDLKDLVASDSPEAFVLSYCSILEVNGAITPAMVEKLCLARSDMTRADVKEVINQCREVYKQRSKTQPLPRQDEGKGWGFWKG